VVVVVVVVIEYSQTLKMCKLEDDLDSFWGYIPLEAQKCYMQKKMCECTFCRDETS
jgi:hypothetical protein